MTKIKVLAAVVLLAVLAAGATKEKAEVRLRQGDVPVGSLGHPLGAYLTIEGKRANGPKFGTRTLRVDTINGKKLDQTIDIGVENIRELPENTRIVLKGYETGKMAGPVPAAIQAAKEKGEKVLLPQRGWQWNAYFIAISAVKPVLTIEKHDTGFKTTEQKKSVRLTHIKLLKILDGKTVRLRTDNAMLTRVGSDGGIIEDRLLIDGATGRIGKDPQARWPDEITLKVGQACQVGGKTAFHKYELMKIVNGEAVIHHTGRTPRNQPIDETIRVTTYEDASWKADPKDPTRITYTEWDEKHRIRTVKHYHDHRLEGSWTQWYDNGQKEFEHHFVQGERDGLWTEWYPAGEKRYEVRYRKGQKVGKEYWWRRDGTVMGIGDHPEARGETKDAPLPRKPMFGAKLGPVTREVQNRQKLDGTEGVVLEQVFPRTAAAEAGLKPGDVILSVDGSKVADIAAFLGKVRMIRTGETLTVEMVRDGERSTKRVTMKEAQLLRLEDLRRYLGDAVRRKLAEGHLPSVSLALVKDDRIIWAEAFGYLNMARRVPADVETVYVTASIFKPVVATAVMQLVDEGKLDLDAPVNRYLKRFQVPNPFEKETALTTRHLLAHRGGLPNPTTTVELWQRAVPTPLEELLHKQAKVETQPGTKYAYSNLGYSLCGYLVGLLSEQSVEAAMKKRLFEPLEMARTGFAPWPALTENLAVPYEWDPKLKAMRAVARVRFDVYPAGDVYSTPSDMARFLIPHLNGGRYKDKQILSARAIKEMARVQFNTDGAKSGVGLGWGVSTESGRPILLWGEGRVPGFRSSVRLDPQKRLGAVFFANNGTLSGSIAHSLEALPELADLAFLLLDRLQEP